MVQTSKRFWQILAVSLALSAAALAWLLPSAFSAESWQQLSMVSPWGLGLLLVALCARWLCGGWRTAILARLTGADLSVLQGVR